MTRSRAVLTASFSIVLAGTALALSALVMDPARAAVGPLPGEALSLPADTRFVMGFDMKRFVASPFYKRYAAKDRPEHLKGLAELEEKTGVNPERDVDSVVVAGRGGAHSGEQGVVLVSGRFDRYKISRAIETGQKGVTWKQIEGEQVYLFDEEKGGRKGTGAFTFLDEGTIALGSLSAVEELLGNRARHVNGLESNAAMLDLVRQVRTGAAFWMVGDKSALAQLPGGHATVGEGPGFNLPALQSVIVVADLDPAVSLEFTGTATDANSAKQLADVFRGVLAMATLQAGQKPELKDLATAVSVTQDQNKVLVNAKLPYALLDAMQPKKMQRTAEELVPVPQS